MTLSPVKRFLIRGLWVTGVGATLALVFVFSFLIAMRVEMRSTQVEVPELVGSTLEEAKRSVEPVDLVLEIVDQRNDPQFESGRVLEQMPRAGASVRRGRRVKLVLSLGGKVLEVPDLVGHAARAVAIELRQEGFLPGDEAHVYSSGRESGQVIAQVPPARAIGVPNGRVHRLVSNGSPERTWVMPDLTGLPRLEAESWITASGFRRGSVRKTSASGQLPGTVASQLPLAGYPIRVRDIVDLTVAE